MIMKTKTPHQNRLMKIIAMPIKALAKARDFYVRSMNNYADKACYGGGVASSYMDPLPRSFSTNSSRSEDNEDFRELMRAASTRTLGSHINLGSAHLPSSSNGSLREELQQASKLKRVPRSASVGMAKIEEDKPCDFGVGVGVAHNIPACSNNNNDNGGPTVKDKFRLFPRSRSYAVGGGTKNSSLF